MNYYEEFGVSSRASQEEIKDAYRSLMRLLHPDHQSDPELQRMAELQARKLNQINAVLSDPERRRRYDLELLEGHAAPIIIHAPPPPPRRAFNRGSIPWIAALVAFGILLIWMASRPTPVEPYNAGAAIVDAPAMPKAAVKPTPAPVQAAPAPAALQHPTSSQLEAEQLRGKLAQLEYERDAAIAQLEHSRSTAPKIAPAPPPSIKPQEQKKLVAALNEPAPEMKPDIRRELAPPTPPINLAAARPVQPAPAPPPTPVPAPVVAQPVSKPEHSHSAMLGSWIYRPGSSPQTNKQLYPPEFIEAVINEDNGVVRGTYRARYKIPDRPVSPDVNFQFVGRISGDAGSVPWSGSGGSHGEVSFRLTADHTLRVDWVASQLGALAFYRGTAILVRRSD
jgi:hypothetical protein